MTRASVNPPPRFRRPRGLPAWFATIGLVAAMAAGLVGCSQTDSPLGTQIPARLLYFEAMELEDQGLYSEAATRLETLVAENPGTRLGTFSYLKLAEIYSAQDKWPEADTNYRQFLILNSNSHLTPYVLYKLMVANYELGLTGLFFPTREVDRDMEPNRRLELEFKRFFLLYPNSIYLDEVRPFYRKARELLAAYELLVGDFYFDREMFHSAIGRYLYLLRNFPEYPDTRLVLEKLIDAYRNNRQIDFADEMERIYRLRYIGRGGGDSATDAVAEASATESESLP